MNDKENSRPACGTCPFWERHEVPKVIGTCHQAPPQLIDSEDTIDNQPCTNEDDWCGHHPDAPKPIYEIKVIEEVVQDGRWVPIAYMVREVESQRRPS